MSKLNKLASLVPMEEIEISAQKQIYDILSLDCLKKLAIMPDVHAGYDMPIGGVALLDGMISPSFIGYDIFCSVAFVNTGVKADNFKNSLKEIYATIIKTVPTGFKEQTHSYDVGYTFNSDVLSKDVVQRVRTKADFQLGTLGGGNHFIELGENRKGELCISVHCGSRNVGHTLAGWYMKKGRMFPIDSELGSSYYRDMMWASEWANQNRVKIIEDVLSVLGLYYNRRSIFLNSLINESHNHAVIIEDGILHRKGATPAGNGVMGVIPANMRDGVYITKGLGNTTYLSSASHGCGRVMGRNAAKKTLDYYKFVDSMSGIVCSTDMSLLDEAPDAYKDINYVMSKQEWVTVEVVDFIKPLLNIKAQG